MMHSSNLKLLGLMVFASAMSQVDASVLEFSPGNLIICRASKNHPGETNQWYLASEDSKVIFVQKTARDVFKVNERPWKEVVRSNKDSVNFVRSCTIMSSCADCLPLDEVLARARELLDVAVIYNKDTCNSEHWVRYWLTGKVDYELVDSQGRQAQYSCFNRQ